MSCIQSINNGKIVECNLPDFQFDQDSIKNLINIKKKQNRCLQSFLSEYPVPTDIVLIEDDIRKSMAKAYLEMKDQVDSLKNQMESIKEALVCMSGESTSIGGGIILSKVVRKGSIDYNKIFNDFNIDVDLEKYRGNPIESWRLSRQDNHL
jgi:predicted DNA binding protein